MSSLRKTKSVKAVLQVFEQTNKVISMQELLERFQDDMNKSTVYRILGRLKANGLLHSFIGKDGLTWYAFNEGYSCSDQSDFHPHFQCLDCGKTKCLQMSFPIPKPSEYDIESASLLLVGKCQDLSSHCLRSNKELRAESS